MKSPGLLSFQINGKDYNLNRFWKENNYYPEFIIVDTGFVDAELMLAARNQYQIDLLGPILTSNGKAVIIRRFAVKISQ